MRATLGSAIYGRRYANSNRPPRARFLNSKLVNDVQETSKSTAHRCVDGR